MKKFCSVILCIVLIFAMSTSAMAAKKAIVNNSKWGRFSYSFSGNDGQGSITITSNNNVFKYVLAKPGENGKLYNGQIIDLNVINRGNQIVKAIKITVTGLTGESSVITIKNTDDLKRAIINQKDNQTWIIMPGKYPLVPADIYISSQNQAGWYFPITANNITIKGNGMPVIYGDRYTANGNYSTQNLVTVFGNNVKIDGIQFMPKLEVNKTICVEGKDFTIANCIFTPNTITADINNSNIHLKDGGALYFSGNKGTVTIKNNIFDYTPVVFDSMVEADSIIIEDNKFTHIAEGSYAVGNVTWANPPVLAMANVYIKNNNFNISAGDIIIKNRLNGTFILNDNKINNIKVPAFKWGEYIILDQSKYGCTGMQVIVDGQVYKK